MRSAALTCVAAMLLLVAGCGDSPESVMDDTLATMNDMAAVLETVKDEATAKSAASKLEGLVEKMKSLKERADKMEKPSKEKEAELEKAYKEKMTAAGSRMMKAMMSAMQAPDAQKHLEPAMKKFQSIN